MLEESPGTKLAQDFVKIVLSHLFLQLQMSYVLSSSTTAKDLGHY